MPLPESTRRAYQEILKEELLLAMGCTEPISIAYGAAILRHALGEVPEAISVHLSGNIIKNVKSVIVPATGGLHGIEAAVSAGIIAGCPERELEVLTGLRPEDTEKIRGYLKFCRFTLSEMESPFTFDMILEGSAGTRTALVHIQGNHTGVCRVERCGEDITARYLRGCAQQTVETTERSVLNVKDIVQFARETDLEPVKPYLLRQVEKNLAIAEEGLRGNYGASIGKILYRGGEASLRDKARAYAAAGSDARMSGCELPVCIISGSGNQGMTASLPVVVYARELGYSQEEMLRALIVSDLITIHQKTGIGCLSAYCGAVSAGCGSGCGICFLLGGGYEDVAHTLVNAVAILSGTICDGAKASCAAKIAMAVEAGLLGLDMTNAGKQFYGGDGIVTKGVENTIRNVGQLAREGMCQTDKEIIRIMLGEKIC